ncbi:MAG: hypothetical protein R3C12_06630 [Planctomycetaceae bacterium]
MIARVCYPSESLTPAEAIARKRAELLEEKGSDFISYTFMLPISVAVAKVSHDGRLQDVVTLDAPEYQPANITRLFWQGWRHYRAPRLSRLMAGGTTCR